MRNCGFVYADSVRHELLGQPEPVTAATPAPPAQDAGDPEEHWEKALKLLYAEKFDWSRLVYDIHIHQHWRGCGEDFYDENVVFLRFCFDKELLKKPLWANQGRILRMVYLNQDLTKAGKISVPRLLEFLVFESRREKPV